MVNGLMMQWVMDQNSSNYRAMNMAEAQHYGKIMLLGEYSLLYGSQAFTIPYRKNKVKLRFPEENDTVAKHEVAIQSNKQLQLFYDYLEGGEQDTSIYIDLQTLKGELNRGIFLESDIPNGYGLGSSGALVAALFSRFGKLPFKNTIKLSPEALRQLQKIFSFLESFFHGESSGIDPLSSFVNRPILIRGGNPEVIHHHLSLLNDNEAFFLIDTKISRKTAPLVKIFREKCNKSSFLNMLQQQYIPLNDGCIKGLLDGSPDFSEKIFSLSDLQLRHFSEMIPGSFKQMWAKGLSSGRYTMKLCGAGGGGYLLCYADSMENLQELLQYRHVEKIPV